jgi:hypothetical protein
MGRMREADGVSRGLDGRRGRFIGNAVAPPLAQFIGNRILEIEAAKATETAAATDKKVGKLLQI